MSTEMDERTERALAYIQKKAKENKIKKKKDDRLNFAVTVAISCAIATIIVIAVLISPTPQIKKWRACDYEEFRIMMKAYKLYHGVLIYDFSDKPYIIWKEKKVYLKITGVCDEYEKP